MRSNRDVSGLALSYRKASKEFDTWARGYGVVGHDDETQVRAYELAQDLVRCGNASSLQSVFRRFRAADLITSAGLWLVAHMTYARSVDPSGHPLETEAFKTVPEGHTGGSLNMVPAYVGYLLANALTGKTRSWVMGQGHCVAAIDAVNTLVGNLSPEQKGRYSRTAEGLSRLVQDFYSYEVAPDGRPAAPLGSHVNAHTGGGIAEGGYLGFVEVQYVHMPLPGESLVAFLSDGAFEEQRGSDWSPRWWRKTDCGLVCPIMILNGRRIEQRTEIAQEGGAEWLHEHLAMSGFDPFEIDGRDPVAFACAIIETEARISSSSIDPEYPVRLPYVIARTIKGYGFPGEGTSRAHNLPLEGNPHFDEGARTAFNEGARRLWVSPDNLEASVAALSNHDEQHRPKEADNVLARRTVALPHLPTPAWSTTSNASLSPMAAIDSYFVRILDSNPELRARVGNPDELTSNQMRKTLAKLKHRVAHPEVGALEAVDGAVITALNEEAVVGAVLGNKGGINLAVTYEAFAVKMLGALRQDIIFARHQKDNDRTPGWIGIPLIVTSHTWENGKNEQSHQDPTMAEAFLGEMSDTARVLFPVDANTAVEALRCIYAAHAQVGCLVVPKRARPILFDAEKAVQACGTGAITAAGDLETAEVQLVAIGAYQLEQALFAHERLAKRGRKSSVSAMIEPARFRWARDDRERAFVNSADVTQALYPSKLPRVIISHTRPEPIIGVLRRIDNGPDRIRVLGYVNHGGTLDVGGMLFANRCTWAHILASVAAVLGEEPSGLLTTEERAAISGLGQPLIVMSAPIS